MKKKKEKELPEDRKRCFIIGDDTFKQDIMFCLNMTKEEALCRLKRVNKSLPIKDEEYILHDDKAESVNATVYPLSLGFLVVAKWPKDSFRRNVGVIAHEIVHISYYILKGINTPLEDNTQEVYAYLTENILYKFLMKMY